MIKKSFLFLLFFLKKVCLSQKYFVTFVMSNKGSLTRLSFFTLSKKQKRKAKRL